MSNKVYGFIGLTGGGTGKLDAIDGSVLSDGDLALGADASQAYSYQLVAASGAAESSPDVISPDTNAGTKRWLRRHDEQKSYRASSPTSGHMASVDADGDVTDSGRIAADVITSSGNLINGNFVSATGSKTAQNSGRGTTEVVDYRDRGDPADADFNEITLTSDGAFHDLDLSAVVPAGAKAVMLRLLVKDDVTGSTLIVRKNGNTNLENSLIIRTQVANLSNDTFGIVPVDSNRVAEYFLTNVVFMDVRIVVCGWFL